MAGEAVTVSLLQFYGICDFFHPASFFWHLNNITQFSCQTLIFITTLREEKQSWKVTIAKPRYSWAFPALCYELTCLNFILSSTDMAHTSLPRSIPNLKYPFWIIVDYGVKVCKWLVLAFYPSWRCTTYCPRRTETESINRWRDSVLNMRDSLIVVSAV